MIPVEVAVVALPRRRLQIPPTSCGTAITSYDLLITKRLSNTFYPGYWELPGGKLEPGEPVDRAASREALEELGVEIVVQAVLCPIEHRYEHALVRLHPCVSRLRDPGAEIRNVQVAAHRWCPLNELPWDNFLPANVRVITSLVRYLDGVGTAGAG